MVDLPILNAVDPTIIQTKTYDRFWIEELQTAITALIGYVTELCVNNIITST